MQHYQISKEMHDFFRGFKKELTKPQMKRLKELMNGILLGKKAILSEVARQNRSKSRGKTVRKQVEQYSDMLPKFPLERMIREKLEGFKTQIKPDTPLYFDFTDITKEFYKKMDCIGNTWDGSEGIPGKGYEIVDVSFEYGNRNGVSLFRHAYSTSGKDHRSQTKEIEKVLQVLFDSWGEIRGTLFFDAGGDNDNLIKILLKKEATFVIRMNSNRGARDRIFFDEEKNPVKMMSWSEPQGMTIWQNKKKRGDKRIVQLSWRKVYREYNGKMILLYLVKARRDGDPNPVVFLTNRCIECESEAAKVYHQYFKRGLEEAVFKCHKDKLGMEKIQLESFEKVKQFLLLYVLADQFLYKLHKAALKVGSIIYGLIKAFLGCEQRSVNKWAVIDWFTHFYLFSERKYKRPKHRYRPKQAIPSTLLSPNPI